MSLGILSGNPSSHLLQDTVHAKADPQTKMKAAAEGYEATFLNQMFGQMFEGIPTDGLGHGGQAEETWRGMLINEYSKSVAKAGASGWQSKSTMTLSVFRSVQPNDRNLPSLPDKTRRRANDWHARRRRNPAA